MAQDDWNYSEDQTGGTCDLDEVPPGIGVAERLRADSGSVLNLICPDCGNPMTLLQGKFGKFYGCSQFQVSNCKGSVSADSNGMLRGFPANAETRAARKAAMDAFERLRTSLSEREKNDLHEEFGAVGRMGKEIAENFTRKLRSIAGDLSIWEKL